MVISACYCSWDIPGIQNLPAHYHYQRFEGVPGNGRLVGDVMFMIDWKQVVRDLLSELQHD